MDEVIQNVTYPDWRQYPLTPRQYAIYTSDAHLMMVDGGRASGKDQCCALRADRLSMRLFNQFRDDYPHEGCCVEIAVLGGLQRQANTLWDKVLRLIPQWGGTAKNGQPNYKVRTHDHDITLFGDGIRWSFLPVVGDGSGLVAPGYDIIIVTEAAFLDETTIRDYIKPLCIRPGGYAGYLMLDSTPENNWWDHAFYVAQTKDDPTGKYCNYLGWEAHKLSSFDNPKMTAFQLAEILTERDANYQRFRRRYLGDLFVDIPTDIGSQLEDCEGLRHVFLPEWVEKCLTVQAQALKPPYRVNVDISWTGNDSLAAVILDANNFVADIELHRNCDTSKIVDIFERLSRDWKSPYMVYDAQGKADVLWPHLQGRGLRIRPIKTPNNITKVKRMELAARMIKTGAVKIPHPDRYRFGSMRMKQNCTRLRRELIEYISEYKPTAQGGYWFYSKPPGGTDDIVDALVLGLTCTGTTVDTTSRLNLYGV